MASWNCCGSPMVFTKFVSGFHGRRQRSKNGPSPVLPLLGLPDKPEDDPFMWLGYEDVQGCSSEWARMLV